MSPMIWGWTPAAVLVLGAALTLGGATQHPVPLRAPLESTVPSVLEGHDAKEIVISEEEQRVAGMSDYLMRFYAPPGGATEAAPGFSLYVGYYESQTQGKTIHSPKNCLPGAGWEPLTSSRTTVQTASGPVELNRYLLQKDGHKALVLYWYQGRGRVAANEYRVKLDLLRDAAIHGRSDEALVRVIVPVAGSEEAALQQATRVAGAVIPAIFQALPDKG